MLYCSIFFFWGGYYIQSITISQPKWNPELSTFTQMATAMATMSNLCLWKTARLRVLLGMSMGTLMGFKSGDVFKGTKKWIQIRWPSKHQWNLQFSMASIMVNPYKFHIWLVVQCAHLEKWWSSSMGRMTSHIWNGKYKNVWNHQLAIVSFVAGTWNHHCFPICKGQPSTIGFSWSCKPRVYQQNNGGSWSKTEIWPTTSVFSTNTAMVGWWLNLALGQKPFNRLVVHPRLARIDSWTFIASHILVVTVVCFRPIRIFWPTWT